MRESVMGSKRKANCLKWTWLSLLVIIIDQLTKYLIAQNFQSYEPWTVIPGWLNITLAYNTGAAFNLLSDAGGWQRWFFILLATGVILALILWLYTLPAQRRWLAVGLALILGGAAGNLLDRVLLGYVIDFIDVYYKNWHFPAFNVADSSITIGAVMLIIDTFWFDQAVVSTARGKADNH